MFTEAELAVIQKLYARKSLSDEDRELIPDLKANLSAEDQRDIPARFTVVTGWANAPKDYPHTI